ncbi:MAG TPA: oxidoreductase [Clostridiales bacterium]|nr:oxidoreductase [Clostridiales bacterium]
MLKADLVGVGVIGTGRAGRVHAQNFARHVPEARLVAVYDPDPVSAGEVAQQLGARFCPSLEQLLAEPSLDAVVIAAPTPFHADLVTAAAEAGKAILCEKPLALTVEEAQRMAAVVADRGVVFVMAFMRRFDQGFLRGRQLIEEGAIGVPLMVKSTGKGPGLPPRWAWDVARSNGMLGEVNSHDFDCLRFLTGREFEWVFAVAHNNKCPELAREFPDFYDTAAVTVAMSGNLIGAIDGACPADYGYDARVEVQGSEGVLFLGSLSRPGTVVGTRHRGVTMDIVDSWRSLFREAYLAEDRHLIECLLTGAEPRSTLEDGYQALRAVVAANRSVRRRQVEEV